MYMVILSVASNFSGLRLWVLIALWKHKFISANKAVLGIIRKGMGNKT